MQIGTCKLLPGIHTCHVPDELEGSFFVHLTDCNGDVAWQVDHPDINANKKCLTWHRPLHDSVICPPDVLRTPNNKVCAGVGANKGLYLPGWYDTGKFRVISAEGTILRCTDGYFLEVKPDFPVLWQDYTIADPIPGQAVQISVWKDGTPLCLVAARFTTRWLIGYYLTTAKRTFFLLYESWNNSTFPPVAGSLSFLPFVQKHEE